VTTATATMTPIEKAEAHLRDLIAKDSAQSWIDRAHRKLERLRAEAREADRRRAEQATIATAVAKEKDAEEARKRKLIADAVERELRERAAPYAEIHYAGHVLRIALADPESYARQTAQEGLRRAAWLVANRFQETVIRSRSLLSRPSLPLDDSFLGVCFDSDQMLRPAAVRGLVLVDGRRPSAEKDDA
jgi:hypothetical protein